MNKIQLFNKNKIITKIKIFDKTKANQMLHFLNFKPFNLKIGNSNLKKCLTRVLFKKYR